MRPNRKVHARGQLLELKETIQAWRVEDAVYYRQDDLVLRKILNLIDDIEIDIDMLEEFEYERQRAYEEYVGEDL